MGAGPQLAGGCVGPLPRSPLSRAGVPASKNTRTPQSHGPGVSVSPTSSCANLSSQRPPLLAQGAPLEDNVERTRCLQEGAGRTHSHPPDPLRAFSSSSWPITHLAPFSTQRPPLAPSFRKGPRVSASAGRREGEAKPPASLTSPTASTFPDTIWTLPRTRRKRCPCPHGQ